MIGHLKIKWFPMPTKKTHMVLFEKARCKGYSILVFEDEDVSFTFEPVKVLGILFISTLRCTLIGKRIHDAYGHFITLKSELALADTRSIKNLEI